MEFKFDQKEIIAVVIVFLLAFGSSQLLPRSTLPDFHLAGQLEDAIAGKPSPLYLSFAASAQSAFAVLFGSSPSSPETTVSFLLLFSPLLLSISAVFLYLSARSLGIGRAISAFGALLYAFSLVSLYFLPGVYGPSQLAALFFSIFLFSLCRFAAKRQPIAIIPAALAALACAYFSASFCAAAIAASLAFAASEQLKGGKRLGQFAILIIAALAGAIFTQDSSQAFSLSSAQSLLVLLPFLIAPSLCAAILYFAARESLQDFLLVLFSLVAAVFSPIVGGMVLVLPASLGMAKACEGKASKAVALACAFFLAFAGVAGLATIVGAGIQAALVAAFMVAVLAPLLLHFYEYKSKQLFFTAALCLVAVSLFVLAFYPLAPQNQFYPNYSDADLSAALSFLSGKGVNQIGLSGGQDAAQFYLSGAKQVSGQNVLSYLYSGKPVPDSGAYLLLSLSDLDSGGFCEGYSSYKFVSNLSLPQGQAALFVSGKGLMVLRSISADGDLMLSDGELLDQYGRAYSSVPLSRMLLLRPDLPFDSQQNRLIVLDEGEGLAHFMKIYSGQASELSLVSHFGKVSIYKVK